ncbi:PREDICTED: coatomer subunit beta'-like [Priapulus caudatus]|nr:PREDICTED: coatomer subunit beta'-like [Priapulus caudatus]
MYLLGYIPNDNRLYLGDKELNVSSFSLLLSVLEYQTAVMRRDFETADKVLPTIPKEQRTRVAHFLEKQGFRSQALAVSCDPEHRFELSLQLGELKIAYTLAQEAQSEQKWKQLAELATSKCQFQLAQECLHHAEDYGGLLLLATSAGNADMVEKLGQTSQATGKNNVAFLSYFLLGEKEKCLEVLINTDRLPEAAFFARSYLPSQVSRVLQQWKESLSKTNKKSAESLADPAEYENLFLGLREAVLTEQFLEREQQGSRPACAYPLVTANPDRNPIQEMLEAQANGEFSPQKPGVGDAEDDENTPSTQIPHKEPTPPLNAAEATPSQHRPAVPPSEEDKVAEMERELELDLENLQVDDNINTEDINLDEDLLADE